MLRSLSLYMSDLVDRRFYMNKRTVIAYFTVDEDRAFDEFGDGPAAYFIHEAGWLEQSGIFLTDVSIADADATDPKEAYLVYLARFAFDHFSDGKVHPLRYKDWCRCQR